VRKEYPKGFYFGKYNAIGRIYGSNLRGHNIVACPSRMGTSGTPKWKTIWHIGKGESTGIGRGKIGTNSRIGH
jgi:hypothetical protein